MIVDSREELSRELEEHIDECDGKIGIQAGHFALNETDGELVPGVFQDIEDEELKEFVKEHPYMGDFPLETWKFGLDLLESAEGEDKDANMFIIVNDWQFVPDAEEGERNTFREEFYANSYLPTSYKEELGNRGLDKDVLLTMTDTPEDKDYGLFFSEHRLRNLFGRQYSNTCELGSSLCAQEYVPFLHQIASYDIDLFISIVPRSCKEAVNSGAREIKKEFDIEMKVINVFPSASKDDFWSDTEISVI